MCVWCMSDVCLMSLRISCSSCPCPFNGGAFFDDAWKSGSSKGRWGPGNLMHFLGSDLNQ